MRKIPNDVFLIKIKNVQKYMHIQWINLTVFKCNLFTSWLHRLFIFVNMSLQMLNCESEKKKDTQYMSWNTKKLMSSTERNIVIWNVIVPCFKQGIKVVSTTWIIIFILFSKSPMCSASKPFIFKTNWFKYMLLGYIRYMAFSIHFQ